MSVNVSLAAAAVCGCHAGYYYDVYVNSLMPVCVQCMPRSRVTVVTVVCVTPPGSPTGTVVCVMCHGASEWQVAGYGIDGRTHRVTQAHIHARLTALDLPADQYLSLIRRVHVPESHLSP
jgi:hypothetical protein